MGRTTILGQSHKNINYASKWAKCFQKVFLCDTDKFQEAICAFANDMPGSGKKGYLLIGVQDNGQICGMKVDDALMKRISGIRSDGNILPLPVMTTEKVQTDSEQCSSRDDEEPELRQHV